MSRVGVDQDHQVVGEPRIFDVGVLAVTRGLLRPLQHPVHLGEVDVAEQRRNHPALRNALFSAGFEHDLQQMHDVGIVHALTYFRQQPIVPDIVEVAAQVDVYHACLLLNDRSRHTVYRFMGCPLWTVSKRPRLEVRLEDWFQYQLERALHHSVADRRNRKDADLAPILRYFLSPGRQRHIAALDQFVRNLPEERLYALRFDGLEGHPVTSRSAIVLFGQRIRLAQCVQLADVDIESPEPPGRLSLRLDVYSPPQVLQIHGRLCHLVLAFLVVGDATSSRAPLLHGNYSASPLLRTRLPPSRLRSTSRLHRLYDLPCSGDFAPGRGGLLQLLGMFLPPCCRFHPAEVKEPLRSDFGSPCCLRPPDVGSAFGATHFRGHIRVYFHYGPAARRLPEGDVVDRLQSLGFPPPCYPNYGAPDFCPGRSVSC